MVWFGMVLLCRCSGLPYIDASAGATNQQGGVSPFSPFSLLLLLARPACHNANFSSTAMKTLYEPHARWRNSIIPTSRHFHDISNSNRFQRVYTLGETRSLTFAVGGKLLFLLSEQHMVSQGTMHGKRLVWYSFATW